MCFADIILKMDPSLSKFMKSLKSQVEKRKISIVVGVAPQPTAIETVLPETTVVAPVVSKKRGRPSKAQRPEVGTSSDRQISMLGLGMRVAPTMQFDLRPEDEGILAVVPTLDLIEKMVELQCRATVVSRAIGDELKRAKSVVIPKLKTQLYDSTLSLKNALEAADKCQEERQRENRLACEEQEALKATLAKVMAERDNLMKEKVGLTTEKESFSAEIEKYQEFMLRVSEESFNQGVHQVAFFHGVSADDSRYDLGKDIVNGELVPFGGEDAEDVDQVMDDPIVETPQPNETIEIL